MPIEGEILADCDVVPMAVRTPIVVNVLEIPERRSLEVIFRDGGVWEFDMKHLHEVFLYDRVQNSPPHLIAEAFVADPRKFHFKKRVRLTRKP